MIPTGSVKKNVQVWNLPEAFKIQSYVSDTLGDINWVKIIFCYEKS